MENAAHAVANVIAEKLGGSVKGKSILILCGPGNNGGDGAALARILWIQGAKVYAPILGKVEDSKGDAKVNFISALQLGSHNRLKNLISLEIPYVLDLHFSRYDVVVDAIFGTGISRPIKDGLLVEMFESLGSYFRRNDKTIYVSLDVPSGLNSDAGEPIGIHLRANITVTFTAPKPTNILAPASSFNGELIVANIGSPRELIDSRPSQLFLAEKEDAAKWLRASSFSDSSYKNKRGHSLIIAGSREFSGAAVLAGNSAMRSGVGLVTLVTPGSSKDATASRILPEIMVRGVAETESGAVAEKGFHEIGDLLEKADSIAIGSGLSQNENTKKFVEKVLANRIQPVVVDADALNLLSPFTGCFTKNELDMQAGEPAFPLILTPHEGEFMRLLGTDDKDAIKDRVAAVREFSEKYNVILVLKGERVLIGEPGGKVVVNPTGNSGLGKAGNGDTLTGIIAGFAAQANAMKIDIFKTVVAAVYIAGMAGDVAEKKFGKRVMTASDVRECLSEVFTSLENLPTN